MARNYECMSKGELIAALEALEAGAPCADFDDDGENEESALVKQLRAHQIELEMQNRELRESQAALEESRSRYADLYDFAPVGYLTLDRSGAVLGANLTALSMLGMPALPSGSPFWTAVPITSKRAFLEHLEACSTSMQPCEVTLSLRTIGGSDRVLDLRTTPLLDRQGQLGGFRTVFSDVTATKRSERFLRFLATLSEQLAGSLDSATTIATVVRAAVPIIADVCIADVRNGAGELKRLEVAFAREVSAETRRNVMHADDGGATTHALVVTRGEPVLFADATAHRSPTVSACAAPVCSAMYVPMSARGRNLGVLTLLTTESGRQFGADDLALAQDIAGRAAMAIDNAELYEQAQRALLLRETILAIASHDLKNPLYAIGITADTLIDYGPSSRDALQVQLTSIKRATSQMERLIEDLLDLSSIQGGRLAIHLRAHEAEHIARDFAETAKTLTQRKRLALDVKLPSITGFVRVDRDRMVQVFANLVGNAVKFTPEGGSITIGSEVRDGAVQFSVSDTGPGISAEALEHVFDAYWQAADQAARGHGLGLYIARGIVEAHGGTMGVSSGRGTGSTFHFTLPLTEEPAAATRSGVDVARPMALNGRAPHSNA